MNSRRHGHSVKHSSSSSTPSQSADLLSACNSLCNRAHRIIIANVRSQRTLCRRNSEQQNHSSASGHSFSTWSGTPAAPPAASDTSKSGLAIALTAESKLWHELKQFKDQNDKSVLEYINGFYAGLLQMIFITWNIGTADPFILVPVNLTTSLRIRPDQLFDPENESTDVRLLRSLIYNLLIRLGDVNRYLKNLTVSRSYYQQARDVDPGRWHAFNQLALISSEDPVAQLYNYVRACNAVTQTDPVALQNFNSCLSKCCANSPVIAFLTEADDGATTAFPFHLVKDWVQVLVIAIHANSTALLVKPLLDQALAFLRRKVGCNPFSSAVFQTRDVVEQDCRNLLSAVDILIDYAIYCEDGGKTLRVLSESDSELKKFQVEVISILAQSDDFAIGRSMWTASGQDYQLLGFKPLKQVHEKLLFESPSTTVSAGSTSVTGSTGTSANNSFTSGESGVTSPNQEFIFTIKKLRMKIDSLLLLINDKSNIGAANVSLSFSPPVPSLHPVSGSSRITSDNSSSSSLTGGGSSSGGRNSSISSQRQDNQKQTTAVRSSRNVALKSILSGN